MAGERRDGLRGRASIVSVWQAQVAEAARSPMLARLVAQGERDLFQSFARRYEELTALPRRARRALQRQLARSGDISPLAESRKRKGRSARHRLAWSVAGAALLLALGQQVQAASIDVDTRVADIDAGDGRCSLAEAIVNATDGAATYSDCDAGDAGADTIGLPRGRHRLTTALPSITSAITIEGAGATIARGRSAPPFTIFSVAAAGDLTLADVTVTGGDGTAGGAVYNQGTLTIERSTITGNRAVSGGGIFNGGGTLHVEDSAITKNSAAMGGGIFDYGGGIAVVQRTTISKNNASYLGAGIHNYSASFTVEDSIITGNRVGRGSPYGFALGAGAYNGAGASLTIENTTISKNKARARYYASGGGLCNIGGTLDVTDSEISGNSADFGAGVYNYDSGVVTVENTTISKNRARSRLSPYGGLGGGIYNGNSTATMVNSTISGNRSGFGGGAANLGTFTIDNSTITRNRGRYAGGIGNAGDLTLTRSLISGNRGRLASEVYNDSGYFFSPGTVAADDFNLFGANGDSETYGFAVGASDIVPDAGVRANEILSPQLADNGGPTQTHALVPGSPAIDVSPAGAGCPATDQRGTARPQGAACDIGAFEL